MSQITRSRKRLTASTATLALIASGLIAAGGPSAASPHVSIEPDQATDKITAEVQEQLDDKGQASVWVTFADRADLSSFPSVEDWDARGWGVYDALTATADASQADVRAQLDAEGARYQSFWISNVIKVSGADADLVTAMAASPDVTRIYPEFVPTLVEPEPGERVFTPSAVEWGVADIRADQVWDEFGVRGEGIVVATVDTGVQFDHPALVQQYRGNNGDGSFSHDYNWFDAAGAGDVPVDGEGHGTHVTGTMIGDDGGGNQIGVAPGATWIASNGCCPSDAALLDSMQWMLAPTRVDGSDPDPAQRPHVVNNSWGTGLPSDDPFGEDIQEAWEAAGIFGMWANGNIGPGCETSGSPGSRIINYSAGAYDQSQTIADFSSRGTGQDGETKPNISAPGVNTRSSVPGGGYANFSGTSMASPHVAGTVALVWSAAPALIGDIPATKALLDDTATDNPDDQCGGTSDDNNVYGEGRLDALLLVQSAPTEDAAFLDGTVTDGSTGEPIEGAQVQLTGPTNRTVTTDEDGAYAATVQAGDYTVQAQAFGYVTESAAVTLAAGDEVTQDFALTVAETGTISGVVTDGSGHGWPLYALVQVDGTPVQTYTDPVTGEYTLTGVPYGDYNVVATAQIPGYQQGQALVIVDGDEEEDFALPVHDSCVAPGYSYTVEGTTTDFTGGLPAGWTVEDNNGSGVVWTTEDVAGRGNLTGGEGEFAIVDSDAAGPGPIADTSLVSASVDLSGLAEPVVIFRQDYLNLGDTADVDVSVDGGTTWTNVLRQEQTVTGPNEAVVPLPMAVGQSDVQVRFRYYEADWAYWWQVDDVLIGQRSCDPNIPGGLVTGNVYDNAGEGINGATVTHDVEPSVTGTAGPTPDDPALDDGFYWLFAPAGDQPFTASARNYGTQGATVTVVADDTVDQDFTLGQGELSLTPESFEFTLPEGETDGGTLTITNSGDVDAEVTVREMPADYSTSTQVWTLSRTGAPLQRVEGEAHLGSVLTAPEGSAADEPAARPAEAPWTDVAPYPVAVQDHAMATLDGIVYSIAGIGNQEFIADVWAYDPDADAWTERAPIGAGRENLVAAVADGTLYAGTGWADTGDVTDTWWAYDAGADAWTEVAPNPVARSAAAAATVDGLVYVVGGCSSPFCTPMLDSVTAYDPATDTWAELAPYPGDARAFIHCGGVSGLLVCQGGVSGADDGTAAAYSYDPAADTWTPLPDAPNVRWGGPYTEANNMLVVSGGLEGGASTNDSFAYDGDTGAWVDLPNANHPVFRGAMTCGIVKAGGGQPGSFDGSDDVEVLPGFDACTSTASDVPWLAEDPVETTVPAGGSVDIEVTVDSTGLVPGTHTSGLRFSTTTPNGLPSVPVTLHVERVVERYGGADRYETAALISQRHEPGVPNVLIATGENFPDALAGSAHAGSYEVPVLLVKRNGIPAATRAELARLQPQNITVLGGDVAVSEELDAQLAAYTDGTVGRLAGADRYETAAKIAALQPDAEIVYVATGELFPDALAAAARAGALDGPVLLVTELEVPEVTHEALEAIAPVTIKVVGGDEAISDAVTVDLRRHGDLERLDGDDRYLTAALLADDFDDVRTVYLATGENFPDALTGSAWAGEAESPMLLAQVDDATAGTRAQVARLNPNTIVVFGGQVAIQDAVAEQLRTWFMPE